MQVICDDFFVPVLEIICEHMDLKPDVAGATFMAAGTSSPEFFSNIMGTFVTKSDLGIGTIVGSAVFNIFGVIAVCGLFSGRDAWFSGRVLWGNMYHNEEVCNMQGSIRSRLSVATISSLSLHCRTLSDYLEGVFCIQDSRFHSEPIRQTRLVK